MQTGEKIAARGCPFCFFSFSYLHRFSITKFEKSDYFPVSAIQEKEGMQGAFETNTRTSFFVYETSWDTGISEDLCENDMFNLEQCSIRPQSCSIKTENCSMK